MPVRVVAPACCIPSRVMPAFSRMAVISAPGCACCSAWSVANAALYSAIAAESPGPLRSNFPPLLVIELADTDALRRLLRAAQSLVELRTTGACTPDGWLNAASAMLRPVGACWDAARLAAAAMFCALTAPPPGAWPFTVMSPETLVPA